MLVGTCDQEPAAEPRKREPKLPLTTEQVLALRYMVRCLHCGAVPEADVSGQVITNHSDGCVGIRGLLPDPPPEKRRPRQTRGNRNTTHCRSGKHEWIPENIVVRGGVRQCGPCRNAADLDYLVRSRVNKTHCRSGKHEWIEENITRVSAKRGRCKLCLADKWKARSIAIARKEGREYRSRDQRMQELVSWAATEAELTNARGVRPTHCKSGLHPWVVGNVWVRRRTDGRTDRHGNPLLLRYCLPCQKAGHKRSSIARKAAA